MRTFGILLLSLTPFLLGLDYRATLKRKSKFITCFKEFVIFTREQIRFSCREVDEIFSLAFVNPHFKKHIFCGGKFSFNGEENLAKRIEKHNDIRLNSDEVNKITSFFNGLGATDTEGQINHCDYFISLFEGVEKKVAESLKNGGRLSVGLSLSLSFALFIIMI